MDAVLLATVGAEPQVVALATALLLARGVKPAAVRVLHTTPPVVPLDDLRSHFGAQQCWPRLGTVALPIADVLTAADIEQFSAALYDEMKRWLAEGMCVHLLLAGGRKPMAMAGMSVAQLLLGPDDCIWYLFSDEGLRLSGRFTAQPGERVELVEVPLARLSPAAPRFLRSFAADSPAAARRAAEQEAQRRLHRFVTVELTPAEREVAALVVQEVATVDEMASRLHKAPKTVTNQLSAIYSKMESAFGLQPNHALKREFLRRELGRYFVEVGS
jgi:DNA-binding CsgD family transcriptional regulator